MKKQGEGFLHFSAEELGSRVRDACGLPSRRTRGANAGRLAERPLEGGSERGRERGGARLAGRRGGMRAHREGTGGETNRTVLAT